MPDVMAVFQRYRRFIAAVTIVATLIAIIVTALLPKKYISVVTALPASSFAADKSTVFNTNIQELYSALGTADDVDRIIGTAQLDTIYIATVHELNLTAHYHFTADANGQERAVRKVKHNTSVAKSEWGELKIKAWDSDRNMAAQIANTVLQKLQALHQALRNQSNQLVLQKLQEAYQTTSFDTTTERTISTRIAKDARPTQRQVYEQLLSEYNLMVATNPPALLVVENARPPLYPDNKEKVASVVLTFFAALIFSGLVALYVEGKKRHA